MRTWEVQGQYGYWVVFEYHAEEGRGTYDTISPIPTKKLANTIAAALNNAYRHGREDAMTDEHVRNVVRDQGVEPW